MSHDPQRSTRRFRAGSAAIFWTFAAALVWLFFYFGLGSERGEVRWFFAWYLSLPVVGTALVALFFQNLWGFAGGSRLESAVAAWVSSIIGFMVLGYFAIRRLFGG
jgi:hypothetical protein